MSQDRQFDFIKEQISNNDIVLFMKGSQEMPMCGFSSSVVSILERLGVQFAAINVLEDQDLRQAIKDFTQWNTIPQLYFRGEFIGGCDIIQEMYHNGQLIELLSK
ncbi:MAG: Grx4 family monothiol glutaredoxin [Rickettsiaceae bacterium]